MYKIDLGNQLTESDFPYVIYKYRIWGDEKDNRILTHKEIYLASPAEFNADYPECKLPERFDLVTDEMLKRKILNDTENEFPWMNKVDLEILSEKRFKRHKFHDLVNRNEVFAHFNKVQDEYLGIFSACLERDNLAMWERFADLSTGYCVGLSPYKIYMENNIKGAFGLVDYYNEHSPPIIIPLSLTESEQINNQLIRNFSVPDKYKYEREYRIAKYNYIHLDGKYIKVKYDIYSRRRVINSNCFKEILLGSDIHKNKKEEIIDIATRNFPSCPIYQAKFKDKNSPITFTCLYKGL